MSPVNEAQFAFDERTPLSLYDSVLPRLKEHRKLIVDTSQFEQAVFDDNKAKAQVLAIEREIEELQTNKIKEENQE